MKNTDTVEDLGIDWLLDLAETAPTQDELELKNYNETYNKKATKLPTKKCSRCSGHGKLAQYTYKSGGVCFKCNGSGKQH